MSGGAFNYDQYKIDYIADEIEQFILDNESEELNQWGDKKGTFYSPTTINEFKKALTHLRMAKIYAQRIDWLVSGDDGEDTFHNRLQQELDTFFCKSEKK
jgi:hypothetical protein